MILKIYTDGSIEGGNPGGHGVGGWVIYSEDGERLSEGTIDLGKSLKMTNNIAEFSAILGALDHLAVGSYFEEDLIIHSDSNLAVKVLKGEWQCWKTALRLIVGKIKNRIKDRAGKVDFVWIPREENKEADCVSRSLY